MGLTERDVLLMMLVNALSVSAAACVFIFAPGLYKWLGLSCLLTVHTFS